MRRIFIAVLVVLVVWLLALRASEIGVRDEPQVVPRVVPTMANQTEPAVRRLLVRYQAAAASCDEGGSR
jgi:hypothetical protein